ncbi:MHC class I [Labeo rohita]|uniref:MHC class I n=1 Tax=Labeo rohita TaxID=84645 RepID=A0A498MCF2_LABRO|nr:MHC class I [Labeo rohita]
MKPVAKTEWIRQNEGADYWDRQTQILIGSHLVFRNNIQIAQERSNHSAGDSVSIGIIVGAVVAAVIMLMVIGIAGFKVYQKKKKLGVASTTEAQLPQVQLQTAALTEGAIKRLSATCYAALTQRASQLHS